MKNQALILLDTVERLGNLLRVGLRQAGVAQGLQPIHLQALLYLNEANRYSNTPQALAEYLGLTKGTVSQSLLLLARRRLIARHADDKDGRVVRLTLTDKGKEVLKELGLTNAWRDALQSASPARLSSATKVLKEALATLQARNGYRSFGVCVTCRHNLHIGPRSYVCGLTKEKLSSREVSKICREHSPVEENAA
ncbi:winged helix-turn-helix transcriptional regulator [Betaproteobacteria bacterium SCN2]|jgi:DNA-binding MarR family transcriptional regulator|nr:winged helix-turn-helix transcriptional regulator [Betaproteobacteria bacterium SCN2]